jgi:hypothetical protein
MGGCSPAGRPRLSTRQPSRDLYSESFQRRSARWYAAGPIKDLDVMDRVELHKILYQKWMLVASAIGPISELTATEIAVEFGVRGAGSQLHDSIWKPNAGRPAPARVEPSPGNWQ